jgi:hypothetical protein
MDVDGQGKPKGKWLRSPYLNVIKDQAAQRQPT